MHVVCFFTWAEKCCDIGSLRLWSRILHCMRDSVVVRVSYWGQAAMVLLSALLQIHGNNSSESFSVMATCSVAGDAGSIFKRCKLSYRNTLKVK